MRKREEQGATGTSAGRQHLEIVQSADVVLHVAWYWAAVEDIPKRTEE
jgi:hypothetical protein